MLTVEKIINIAEIFDFLFPIVRASYMIVLTFVIFLTRCC